jgi:hypothetical protein
MVQDRKSCIREVKTNCNYSEMLTNYIDNYFNLRPFNDLLALVPQELQPLTKSLKAHKFLNC